MAFLAPNPSWEAGKGTKAEGLCQTSTQAEPGAGRAGWQQQGAEVCAHIPPWHAAGNNGERLMPGVLPARGSPIRARLCFWCRMQAWTGGAQSAAPPPQRPGSQPCFIWLQWQSHASLLSQQSVFPWDCFLNVFRAGQTLKTHFQHYTSVATSSAGRLLRQRRTDAIRQHI